MKIKQYVIDLLTFGFVALAFSAASAGLTAYYYQHLAVVHNAATYEASSWGNVSFHWNDVSYAQAPFEDQTPYEKIRKESFDKELKAAGVK